MVQPQLGAETDALQIDRILDRTLTAEELEDLTAPDEVPVDVTFSSQDFDVVGLVRRLETGSMLIPQLGLARRFHGDGALIN